VLASQSQSRAGGLLASRWLRESQQAGHVEASALATCWLVAGFTLALRWLFAGLPEASALAFGSQSAAGLPLAPCWLVGSQRAGFDRASVSLALGWLAAGSDTASARLALGWLFAGFGGGAR
jgi:hypothetical protein